MRVFLNLLAATAGGQLSRARAFLDRFHDFAPTAQLIIAKEQSVLTEYVTSEKMVFIDVPIGMGKLKALRRMWWENTELPKAIRNSRADVFLTFSHYLPYLNFPQLPTVVGVSNLAPFSTEAWIEESLPIRLKLIALRRTILSSAVRATRVVALSNFCRDVLIANGVAGEKILVAPNGVDVRWSQLPTSNEMMMSRFGVIRPYLLYVSHIHRYKNFGRLIEAYAGISPDVRKIHQLVLIGKPYDDRCYQAMMLSIERLGLTGEVIVIPGLNGDELKEYYQNAKLFVFPSLIENSPNILLEAMAAGLPVISSDLAPMPEYCENAAEYFNPLDVSEMSQKIESLLMAPNRLTELKAKSSMQAEKYSWANFVASVVGCLGTVSNGQ